MLEQALRQDISPYFGHNGQYPDSGKYTALSEDTFADYRVRINELVNNPGSTSPWSSCGLTDVEDAEHLARAQDRSKHEW